MVDYILFKIGYEVFIKIGVDVMYIEFNDIGYGVWRKVYEEFGLIDWIFFKKKMMFRF